jgi:hypothetical protein
MHLNISYHISYIVLQEAGLEKIKLTLTQHYCCHQHVPTCYVSKMFVCYSTAFGRLRKSCLIINPQLGRVDGVGTVGVVDHVGITFGKAGAGDGVAHFQY